jgi:hypothetical protein
LSHLLLDRPERPPFEQSWLQLGSIVMSNDFILLDLLLVPN